jgi:tRNA threonylcarbamoyl adenosine modification protein YjeE
VSWDFSARDALDTKAFGAALGRAAAEGLVATSRAGLVIGLVGDLGAGKTTLTQGLVAGLPGGDERMVTSPTFSLVHRYPTTPPVTHLDLYRLGSLEALESIGYRELYFGVGLVLVEWIDQVPEAVPPEWLEIHLAVGPADVREFRLRAHGQMPCDFGAKLEAWKLR